LAVLGGAPVSRDLSAIYDPIFYESYNAEQEKDIRLAADGIVDVLRPRSALDVGCGPGMMVRRLREREVHAWGFDGSEHAIAASDPSVRRYIWQDDLTRPVHVIHKKELVICTEVAEHVPEYMADRLVQNLCQWATEAIVLTAARPGQGGHDHVNEQPMHYWLDRFAAFHFDVDEVLTAALRESWQPLTRMRCYVDNVRALVRAK
jgi:trans-aconitate methyltransferase